MKAKKLKAILKGLPWLINVLQRNTGVHALDAQAKCGSWEKHTFEWAQRNVSEIAILPFSALGLDEAPTYIGQTMSEQKKVIEVNGDWRLRQHVFFSSTFYYVLTHERSGEKYTNPFSLCWDVDDTSVKAVFGEYLRDHAHDAVVRVNKVGVRGRCSSFIIDIFYVPGDFVLPKN